MLQLEACLNNTTTPGASAPSPAGVGPPAPSAAFGAVLPTSNTSGPAPGAIDSAGENGATAGEVGGSGTTAAGPTAAVAPAAASGRDEVDAGDTESAGSVPGAHHSVAHLAAVIQNDSYFLCLVFAEHIQRVQQVCASMAHQHEQQVSSLFYSSTCKYCISP